MKFTPKRDLWLSLTIWISVLVLVGSAISPFLVDGAGRVGGTIIFAVCIICAAFTAWLWAGVVYLLRESDLFIRMGPFSKSIPYDQISKAKKIRSILASSATSIDRIEIQFNKYDYIQISPLEQDRFLDEMQRRCSNLVIER